MKESLKLTKSFVCNCGREYSLEISTDLAVENLLIDASCPHCGEKRTITAGSLLVNRAPPSPGQYSESQESDSSALSFMDSDDTTASETSGESTDDSIYTDMFDK